MQIDEQKDLWKRIQDFIIDDPSASVKYSDKLAFNNHWSGDYTIRVIEEYKKFMFLCCVLPRGASPSKPVDEAWHLHLTYTHNYWKEFCSKVLGKEIHHHPSKGGTNENHKHEEWYSETLKAYKQFFGYNLPDDIWLQGPILNTPAQPLDTLSHINSYKWFLPFLIIPFVITAALFDRVLPFNLTGPQFLLFYPMLGLVSLMIIYLAAEKRIRNITRFVIEHADKSATVYQLARFIYNRDRSVEAAVIDLVNRNLLEPGWRNSFTFYPSRYEQASEETNPILPTLIQEKQEGEIVLIDTLRRYYDDHQTYHPLLSDLYGAAPSWDIIGIVLTCFTSIVGALRIIQGAVNDKPFSYLFVMIVAYLVFSIILLSKSSERSIIKTVFKDRFNDGSLNMQLNSAAVVSSFLFVGLASIPSIAGYQYLQNTFGKKNNNGWNSSPDVGTSGCGSDGGGSSCGSSCGGGGCGGCGGGGD
ncbi:MAG: hypothetical protein QM764_22520 [Chitinophagaceae bacterium]